MRCNTSGLFLREMPDEDENYYCGASGTAERLCCLSSRKWKRRVAGGGRQTGREAGSEVQMKLFLCDEAGRSERRKVVDGV